MSSHSFLICLKLLLILACSVTGINISVSDFVSSLLSPDIYNKKERPFVDQGQGVIVNVDIYVSSISGISEISMDYSINIFLRQRWRDPRLQFPPGAPYNTTLTLNHDLLSMFWQADLFIKNERTKGSFHDLTVPNVLLTVSPDGSILYSQRVSSRLACDMALQQYPLDVQYCAIEFESYGHTTRDITFKWRDMANPVQINENMQLPEFNLTGVTNGDCTAYYTTGSFSCINATFQFKRLFEYYLIQVYVPSILIVFLSWVSFWIDIHAVPARISVGLLTVLTITTQQSGISAKLPRVSYIKAIDVWMFTSMVFVFGALIEYSVVNVLARSHKAKVALLRKKYGLDEDDEEIVGEPEEKPKETYTPIKENGFHTTDTPAKTDKDTTTQHSPQLGVVRRRNTDLRRDPSSVSITSSRGSKMPDESQMTWCQKVRFNKALLLDVVSRIFFPGVYIVFQFVYWMSYLEIF